MTVVWTNLHGGFLALIALLGVARRWGWRSRRGSGTPVSAMRVRYGALTCACAAASLVNPYGIRVAQHVIEYLRSDWIRNVIQEFQSPSFRNENMLQFEALLFARTDGGRTFVPPRTRGRRPVDYSVREHGAFERAPRAGLRDRDCADHGC